ncbi:hypothetical protein ACVWZZ_001721 [Bradyrhizobium sp. LM6.10]
MDRLFVLAGAIVLAGFLSGGVYSVTGGERGNSTIINRFTGSVWGCTILECTPTAFKISN